MAKLQGRAEAATAGVERCQSAIARSQRQLLGHILEVDAAGRWRTDGCQDMAQWLAGRFGISNWMAHRWVVAAHALERLPLTAEALESGRLSLDKVVELVRFATPETERKLIRWARRVSPGAIRDKAALATRAPIEDIQAAEDDRKLQWWWFDDGKRLGLYGEFAAAQGAAITTAITRAAERLPELPADERRTAADDPALQGFDSAALAAVAAAAEARDRFEQRCADALFALASVSLSGDADADRATVVVHTSAGAARGEPCGSQIEGGPVLHPEVARRLACDCRLQFVLSDKDGNALGIGRAARNVPAWLMRQLRYRDHTCTFPGCHRKAFLQAHHIDPWEEGGPTDLTNLVLVCHFYHKLVHEYLWKVRLNNSHAEWFRPNGKRYDPGPDPPHESEQLPLVA